MPEKFVHTQSAHCENGVTTSLLRYHGLDFMNEPLAFGMGSGLFYIHIPFIKMNGGPGVSFRTLPGNVFNKTCRSLGISVKRKKFSDHKAAQDFLDLKITEGVPVGCQVGVYNLVYLPVEYRFHFNAHNIIIYGKENGRYLVSDPVMETTTELSAEELDKVRFAKGIFAPKGHIYFPENVGPADTELLKKGIVRGIKRNVRDMLHIPGNIAGVSGIKYTSRKIRKWRDQLGVRRAGFYLAHIVRMMEEIGTGGGGFRFIYSAFLEQSADILKEEKLQLISENFTKAGDLWRSSAVEMAGIYKGRITKQEDFNRLADILLDISETEKQAFKKLSKIEFAR
jgi:hypothetical protein